MLKRILSRSIPVLIATGLFSVAVRSQTAITVRILTIQAQQKPPVTPPADPLPDERSNLYSKWLEHSIGGVEQQKVAYETANEFIRKFPTPEDESLQTLRKWLAKYEKDSLESALTQSFNAKDMAKTFEAGRKILAAEPENFRVLSMLVLSGSTVGRFADSNVNREAADYSRRALKLIEGGKVSDLASFRNEEDATGYLNYALGRFLADASPAEAVQALRKAASSKTSFSQEPTTYLTLANALTVSDYTPIQAEYEKKYAGKPQNPEGQALLEKLNRAADRLIDAYARTVALLTKPGQEAAKAQLMTPLTNLYKSRNNNSDAGLNELIATVLSKPLP